MHRTDDRSNVLRLYEELGVRPEDGLDRLSERYRARLRELHPDGRAQAAAADLGWLTRSYRDAVAFHRQHGRLPGADVAHANAADRRLPTVAARRHPHGPRRRWRWLLPMLLGLALLAIVRVFSA
jgi:hypothetical protein